MAQTPEVRLGGLVLGTDDPQRLATWYKAAFAPDAESGEVRGRTVVELGAGRLVFDRRDDLEIGRASCRERVYGLV